MQTHLQRAPSFPMLRIVELLKFTDLLRHAPALLRLAGSLASCRKIPAPSGPDPRPRRCGLPEPPSTEYGSVAQCAVPAYDDSPDAAPKARSSIFAILVSTATARASSAVSRC